MNDYQKFPRNIGVLERMSIGKWKNPCQYWLFLVFCDFLRKLSTSIRGCFSSDYREWIARLRPYSRRGRIFSILVKFLPLPPEMVIDLNKLKRGSWQSPCDPEVEDGMTANAMPFLLDEEWNSREPIESGLYLRNSNLSLLSSQAVTSYPQSDHTKSTTKSDHRKNTLSYPHITVW